MLQVKTGGDATERRKEGDGFRLTCQTAESVRRCCRYTRYPANLGSPSGGSLPFPLPPLPSACGPPFGLTRIHFCTKHAVKMRLTDQAGRRL